MIHNKTAVTLVANAVYNTTRLFKITKFLTQSGRIEKLTIIGFWEVGLKLNEERSELVRVRRMKTLKQKFPNAPGYLTKFINLLSLFSFFFTISRACLKEKPKVIYCHDVVMLPVALMAKFLISSTIIYMPHELETLETGTSKFVNFFLKRIEWVAMRFVKHTIVVSPKIKDWYSETYCTKKVSLIRNIPEFFEGKISSDKKLRKFLNLSENDIIFIYQGLIDRTRGVAEVASTFINAADNHKQLVFMGYGPDVSIIESLVEENKNIHYIPAVEPSEIYSYTSDADVGVLLIFEEVSKSYEYSLPNKYFEYVKSGIPIVVSDNLVSINDEISKHSTGWIIESVEGRFKDFLLKITREEIHRMKLCVSTAQKEYNWESEVKVLLEFLGE
jgi:glycosyltransferase involved in cell wall biosynthesis